MKIDFYTKAVLTVIAVMLTLIASKQLTRPSIAVQAAQPIPTQSHFAVGPDGNFYFYADHEQVIGVNGPKGEKKPDIVIKSSNP